MDNIESCIWFFCLDHSDTNITRVTNFIEWIFVTGNYIFYQSFYRYTPHVIQCPYSAHTVPTVTLRCVTCDVGQPVSIATSLCLFWSFSKLGSDLGDLTVICSAATTLYEISQRPSGDQRRSGWFCRSQRGRHPVWLWYFRTTLMKT